MAKNNQKLISNLNNYEKKIQKAFPNNRVSGLSINIKSEISSFDNTSDCNNIEYSLCMDLQLPNHYKKELLGIDIEYYSPNDSTWLKATYINPISNRKNYIVKHYAISHWNYKSNNLDTAIEYLKKELLKRKLIK